MHGNGPQETLGGSLEAQAVEDADPSAAHYIQQGVTVPAPAKGKKSRLCRRLRREAKAAADAAGAATWAHLLGGEMDAGQVEESEEEHDDWRDYFRVKDDKYDHNF
jgi:hypothetical protein